MEHQPASARSSQKVVVLVACFKKVINLPSFQYVVVGTSCILDLYEESRFVVEIVLSVAAYHEFSIVISFS